MENDHIHLLTLRYFLYKLLKPNSHHKIWTRDTVLEFRMNQGFYAYEKVINFKN